MTFILNYDAGMINPGSDVARLQKATLDASNWGVHFEADMKDRSGKMAHVIVDGKIENVTAKTRKIIGTWTQGGVTGDFEVTSDD
ncbi:MAG TPA: hypothetical protein VIY49_10170 [Bryobacteraceae bacterium]